MIQVEMRKKDVDNILRQVCTDNFFPQGSDAGTRVNDRDAVRVGERDLQAGGIAAELLKTGITDGDGSPRTIKLELHKIVL